MHVVSPVFVLAEGATVACLVAPAARLRGLTTTVPATLGGEGGVGRQWRGEGWGGDGWGGRGAKGRGG